MALVYNFAFPPPAAGETVTVTDDSGTEVGSGDLGSTVGTDGAITLQVSLPEGGYIGTVEGSFGTWTTRGLLDVPDSIEDQPGASETAYLIATGTGVTDGGYTTGLNFTADDRYGELPEWVTLVAGDPTLGSDAGGCVASARVLCDMDFSGTTPPDAPAQIGCYFRIQRNASTILTTPGTYIDGDGEDLQSVEEIPGGVFVFGGTLTVDPSADATAVADGVAAFTVALNITRLAPAPTLPA